MEGRALLQYIIDISDVELPKKQEATEYLAALVEAAQPAAGAEGEPCPGCGGLGGYHRDGCTFWLYVRR